MVEDDELMLEFLAHGLGTEGFEVIKAKECSSDQCDPIGGVE